MDVSRVARLAPVRVRELDAARCVVWSIHRPPVVDGRWVQVISEEVEHPRDDEGSIFVCLDPCQFDRRDLSDSLPPPLRRRPRDVVRDRDERPAVSLVQPCDECVLLSGVAPEGHQGCSGLSELGGPDGSHLSVFRVDADVDDGSYFLIDLSDSLREVRRSVGVELVVGFVDPLGVVGRDDEVEAEFVGLGAV